MESADGQVTQGCRSTGTKSCGQHLAEACVLTEEQRTQHSSLTMTKQLKTAFKRVALFLLRVCHGPAGLAPAVWRPRRLRSR